MIVQKIVIRCFLSPVVSVDEDQEVMGNLKVSLEAAKALTGIYQEFHNQDDSRVEDRTDEDEEEEEEEKQKKNDEIQVLDYEDESVFY